ncbi:hypothetical protein [Anaerotruncus colihominis]|uniref:Uncharacterized protein n=1 Tax=Anaerotruncus colihominis TaxID=169435 RepID=A0A1Y4MQ66_9FIRM|nr:hypothetical protein [Anaerotruncus colihominis]OUO68189.1 hypothetical protein B5F55_04800 [Anaerotruncus colihominis]OUP69232.1 hypothetical protein B5F11_10200 [Anaerotruncus colihominis]OUP70846.1 hypothetical protein B5F10_18310 [Anaerotruncus colihominis]
MNKLTKTIGITLLAGLMALSLAACGGDKPAADTTSPAASAPASSEAADASAPASSDAVSSEAAAPAGEAMTEEEYANKISELMTGLQEEATAVQQLDPSAADYNEKMIGLVDGLNNAFKEIAALTPPESLATMHDAFVSASGKMDEATTLFKEGLAMDPAAEAEAMQAKLTEASQKYGEALQELQSALMTMGTEAGAATSSEAAASEGAASEAAASESAA